MSSGISFQDDHLLDEQSNKELWPIHLHKKEQKKQGLRLLLVLLLSQVASFMIYYSPSEMPATPQIPKELQSLQSYQVSIQGLLIDTSKNEQEILAVDVVNSRQEAILAKAYLWRSMPLDKNQREVTLYFNASQLKDFQQLQSQDIWIVNHQKNRRPYKKELTPKIPGVQSHEIIF